jgi:hypothetical protein
MWYILFENDKFIVVEIVERRYFRRNGGLMKNVRSRVTRTIVAVVLAVSMVFAVAQPVDVAAAKPYMKNLKVSWDLENDKEVTYKTIVAGVGNRVKSTKITNYEIADAAKSGYKKVTFTVTFKNEWKPSKNEVHECVYSSYIQGTGYMGYDGWYAIVDYNTGIDLEEENDFDVTVKTGKWKKFNKKNYKDKDGCGVRLYDEKVKVTVTYPEDYDGLCIGVGGKYQLNESKADIAFWNGKKPFGKTSYSKNGKKSIHFMRVTE